MNTTPNGAGVQRMCSIVIACLLITGCAEQEQASSGDGDLPPSEQGESSPILAASPDMVALPAAHELVPVAAGLVWDVPEGWVAQAPTSSMRSAQYDADGVECVVYHFGSGGRGGSAQNNIKRWSSQVLDDEGLPCTPTTSSFSLGGLQVTTVALRGTYMSGMSGAGERTPEPGSLFLGAIVEGGQEGTLFVRMVGPESQVDAQREAWEMMVRTIRVVPSG